jgi:hypothetical protein
MKRVPHSHFGMPGSIQKHTLVYTVVLGLVLTAFFDLTRIAALGIIFYLIMDIAVHWDMLALFAPRHSRQFTDPVHGSYVRPIDTGWIPLGEDRVRSTGCDGGDSWHGNHSDGRSRISQKAGPGRWFGTGQVNQRCCSTWPLKNGVRQLG